MAASFEELGHGEAGEDLPRPREDGPGGEERVLLGGEHRHRPPEVSQLFLGGGTGEPGVQAQVPVGSPDLPDGGAEGGVVGLRQYGSRGANRRSCVGLRR